MMVDMHSSEAKDESRLAQFRATCKRWACQTGSPSDSAAVAAVSTNAPLSREHDPLSHGLDSNGLAPEHLLHAFIAVKEDARSKAHSAVSSATKAAISDALTVRSADAPAPPYTAVATVVSAVGGSPLAGGIAEAAVSSIGSSSCAGWAVARSQLEAIGPGGARLVSALVSDGWRVEEDPEDPGRLVAIADPKCSDADLMRIARAEAVAIARSKLRPADRPSPAGHFVQTQQPRLEGTRAGPLRRFWWSMQLAFIGKFWYRLACTGRRRSRAEGISLPVPSVKRQRL